MNSADRYILKEFGRRGVVTTDFDLERVSSFVDRGFCELVEYIDEASKPHPSVICQVVLTAKGMEATGG